MSKRQHLYKSGYNLSCITLAETSELVSTFVSAIFPKY